MGRIIPAAALYSGLVFAAGFILGAARTLLVAPLAGDVVAVSLELPVMLAVSWRVCGWVMRRRRIEASLPRGLMGALAFALLMLAEAGLALAMGRTLHEHLANYLTVAGIIGLVGQLGFAAIPLICRSPIEGPRTSAPA